MSDQWMYQEFGQDFGPISFSDLQQLASSGTVTADSEVRAVDSFSWQRASTVAGLKFRGVGETESSPVRKPKSASDMEVVVSGADEWYCAVGGMELGPLSFEELLEMAKSQQLAADDQVKLGASGKWRRVGSIGRLMAALPYQAAEPPKPKASSGSATQIPRRSNRRSDASVATPTSEQQIPASDETPQPVVDHAEAYQSAFLKAKELIAASIIAQAETAFREAELAAKHEVAWAYAPNVDKQWWGWMGSVEFGPIEFTQLLGLAQNGQLKPSDFVRNGAFGQFVPSSNLPGLYSAVAKIAKAMEALALAQAQAKAAVAAAASIPMAQIQAGPKQSDTPRQEIAVVATKAVRPVIASIPTPVSTRATSLDPNALNSPAPSRIRQETPAEPVVVRQESKPTQKRNSDPAVSVATVSNPEISTEDDIRLRIEECLEGLNIPGTPRIGYALELGVVTVRGTLGSEGERLLVLRRIGAISGIVRVVDSLTVAQPIRSAIPTIPAPVASRPQSAKKSPQPSGPGLFERLKESLAGEYRNHAIAAAACLVFAGYWFYPRSVVRPVAVHPVKGRVVIDGEPLANAAVVLHRVGAAKSKLPANTLPHAKAAPDGSFALGTFESADGAPEGDFVATVFLVEEKIESDGERTFGPNLLPIVYSKPESSPFKLKITSATKELEPLQLTRQ